MTDGLKGVSISWLAEAFGYDRRTVAKKVTGLGPVGKRGNAKLYAIKDAAPLLCVEQMTDWEQVNPDELPPLEMQQYWNAQKAKAQTARENDKLLLERGLLLEYDNMEYALAALLRQLREGLLVAGDVIDAETGLSAKQRKTLDVQIDTVLANLAKSVERMFDDDDLSES